MGALSKVKRVLRRTVPMATGAIEVYPDEGGGFSFRVKGNNGEIVASSESYTTRTDAHRGFRALRRAVEYPELRDL